ncbi:MAG: ABC transporter permease [Tepidanaerobacteraceae bacterium]|jgi:ABC-type dipeptide/oligopeptide/nickel transport system permease subunit
METKTETNTKVKNVNRKMEGRSLWMDGWIRLKRNKLAMFGMWLVIIICLSAIFAPYITRYDPNEQFIWTEGASVKLAPPSSKYWFGTDVYGRDIYTRVIYGARISLQIGFAATTMSVIIGVVLGSLAGYYGGFVDDAISWLTNVIFAFPFLLFVLALVAYLPPSLPLLYMSIGIISWASFARVARGQVIQVKEMEYVEAATAIGGNDSRIIFKHILPNILAPIIVQATLEIGSIIMLESSLSFLGFGIQPPKPAWGYMISEGKQYFLSGQWWWSVFPGLAIMALVLGFNLFGDGLRDALDPRLKQ